MNENLKGYYLNKTGDRVKQLLDRQFIVPTLDSIPNSQTKTWKDGEYTVEFRIGELCRVKIDNKWKFYRLSDIDGSRYIWENANTSELPDMSDYYTKEETDKQIEKHTPDLSDYATKDDLENVIDSIPIPDVNGLISAALVDYVKKVEGKGLSTNDFTDELKAKLEGVTPYDPSELEAEIGKLETAINTLVGGNASNAIESFNEIIAFLKNVSDTESLSGIIAGINARIAEVEGKIPTKTSQLENDSNFLTEHQSLEHLATKDELKSKQDVISDLLDIREGAAKGATALQYIPDEYITTSELDDKIKELEPNKNDLLTLEISEVGEVSVTYGEKSDFVGGQIRETGELVLEFNIE